MIVSGIRYIKDTTIYTYATDAGGNDTDVVDYTTTYKGGAFNNRSGTSVIKNILYYSGKVRGEELTDYSYGFSGDNSRPSTTTIYYYGTGIRADSQLAKGASSAAMTASEVYYGDKSTYTYATSLSLNTDIKSGTYYFGYKGDELTDWSQNFAIVKTTVGATETYGAMVKDTTFYAYWRGGDVLFSTAVYKGGTLNIRTPPSLTKSVTWYWGYLRGEELADYMCEYAGDNTTAVSTTYYFYGTDSSVHLRAKSAASLGPTSMAMTASAVYNKWAGEAIQYGDYAQGIATNIRSKTHYFGYKGDELADYSQSFMILGAESAAMTVKDTTVYAYINGDILSSASVYKAGSPDTKDTNHIMKSYTRYQGSIRGDERVDYVKSYSGN
ncbi:MAG TPA: hypothetical protein PLV52_07410, partial [Candidatus Omnitrophota bacterium]|nr:hypothetical protein [Candidatus Omnitrophota bacterium]